jgi:hypothetical protein
MTRMDDSDGRLGWTTRMDDSDGRLGWTTRIDESKMTRMDGWDAWRRWRARRAATALPPRLAVRLGIRVGPGRLQPSGPAGSPIGDQTSACPHGPIGILLYYIILYSFNSVMLNFFQGQAPARPHGLGSSPGRCGKR